ncbi:MAG: hypothetical protein NWF08_08480 [Candidatus Bathyarchaeota archaeon]|nr:hypothetical protein [Candidatus Bathyarchaeota archaeon]
MTCYFRHMKPIFNKMGLEITNENKKEIDKAIHDIVGVEYKNCSATWREVKKRISEDEESFTFKLKESVL